MMVWWLSVIDKYNMVSAKLENADAHISDLKQQLDNALGAEEMLEQLTERTLFMGEVSRPRPFHLLSDCY